MPEYIERKTIVQWLKEAGNFLKIEEDHKRVCHVIGKIIDHIEAMPTADVAEVVRCRDCRFWNKMSDSAQGRCILSENYPTGTYFCANGKKRMDGDTE